MFSLWFVFKSYLLFGSCPAIVIHKKNIKSEIKYRYNFSFKLNILCLTFFHKFSKVLVSNFILKLKLAPIIYELYYNREEVAFSWTQDSWQSADGHYRWWRPPWLSSTFGWAHCNPTWDSWPRRRRNLIPHNSPSLRFHSVPSYQRLCLCSDRYRIGRHGSCIPVSLQLLPIINSTHISIPFFINRKENKIVEKEIVIWLYTTNALTERGLGFNTASVTINMTYDSERHSGSIGEEGRNTKPNEEKGDCRNVCHFLVYFISTILHCLGLSNLIKMARLYREDLRYGGYSCFLILGFWFVEEEGNSFLIDF